MAPFIKKVIILASILAFVLFAVHRLFFFTTGIWENVASTMTKPFITGAHGITKIITSWQEKKQSYKKLLRQYEQLKIDHDTMRMINIELASLVHYDTMSKELCEFKERYATHTMKLAKILVKNITDTEHYFLLDKGSKDGIQKNMVALYKHQILGKISEVYPAYSKVLLITDQNCKVAAYTQQTNAQGIVRGQNNKNRCNMGYVSHLYDVVDNDLVISSGQGLIFPEGFCLGKVQFHELKEKSLYHEIEVEPLIDLTKIDHCLITHNAITDTTS
ncbi:MAG: Cell shape-determining protein MreC [candidate division TM6 bacterium GW2011_GWF2_38_10]|nr:MAG: Cell shape-determining protein MreC [candidate division TM6 bacterium GW2011_GWF2_38_10]